MSTPAGPLFRSVRMVAVLVACVFTFAARAQTAPDGNAHPTQQNISLSGRDLPNPFGEPARTLQGVATGDQKIIFAESLDLSPLRGLAVSHNGRVKVLDTLARETVRRVTGRADYREDELDPADPTGRRITTRKFDTLFTLFDMAIDPAYYIEKPLIGVEYLPLRTALVEAAFPKDDARAKRYLKLGRVSPRMISDHAPGMSMSHMDDASFQRGLGGMDQSIGIFLESKANFVLVAPATADQPWAHLSTLAPEHPARVAAASLGQAWRARDAAAANAAIKDLARELPTVNAAMYPTTRRSLELLYNRANAFEWGFWAYGVSLLCLLLAFATGRSWLASTGTVLLVLGIILHAFAFITRCIIAERFAIQNQFESMTGLSLFGVIASGVIMMVRKQFLFGAAGAAVGFMVLIVATQTAIPGQFIAREAAILNTSVLLKYHVTTVLYSYSFIALGFVLSLFYLGNHYAAMFRKEGVLADAPTIGVALGDERGPIGTRARLLADLDTAQMVVLQLAFWTLGVGILLGAWWADHSWGRWWAFDPKETWALITWIVYLIVIHVRIAAPARKGFTTAWLSVVGFIVMLWTYFGVNLLLPGLHAYA